jgi:4-amino-4-deoxy-L-arabinose transferase-like glycosyltransferase
VAANRLSADRTRIYWLVPVLLLAAAVRLLGLGNQDLWGDEAFSVMTAVGRIGDLIGSLSTGEPHPPLYPLLLAGWLRLLGRSEFVSRVPSAFAGIASVAVAASLARSLAPVGDRAADIRASLIAGVLVALNPFQVWYSQEARMYAQVSFFAGLSTLLLLRMRRGARWGWLPYAASVVGVAGSHYYGLFVPLAHGVVVAVDARTDRKLWLNWLRAVGLAALLYLPWVYLARDVFLHYYGARPGTVDLPAIAINAYVRLAAGWSVSWRLAVVAALFLTVIAALGVAWPARSPRDRFLLAVLVSWLATPFVAGFLISLVRPMYAERYLVVSSLPFILLVARGISGVFERGRTGRLGWRWLTRIAPALGTAALGACLVVALGPLDNVWIGRYVKSTYNTHVRDVTALYRPNDAVILDGNSQHPLYSYYVSQPWPTYSLPHDVPLDPAKTAASLSQIATTHQGAWIFLYATVDYDPGYFVARWLTQHAYRGFDDWAVSGRLQYYRFVPDAAMAWTTTDLAFGDALRLDRFALDPADLASGDSIPIAFTWERLAQPGSALRISLRLVDGAGTTWAQSDQEVGGDFYQDGDWPTGQPLQDHHALLIPPGTPPGAYRLVASLYQADGGQPDVPHGAGATIQGNGLVLGTAHVTTAADHIWPAGLAGFHPTTAAFANSLELLGFAGSDSVTAGQSAYLTVVWKALSDRPEWSAVDVTATDANGKVAQRRTLPLAPASFPTSAWQSGNVVRQQYNVSYSARLAPGRYQISLLPTGANLTPLVAAVPIGSLDVKPGAPEAPVTPAQHPLTYTFGGNVDLVGYDLTSAPARAGQPVRITLHWLDRAPLDADYTVFVHLLNSAGTIVAQRDQPPRGGERPTSAWSPGDEIVDPYQLDLPANLPSGTYVVEVGLYRPSDGSRLPVTQAGQPAGDHATVTHLEIAS